MISNPCESNILCGISVRFQTLSPSERQVTHALLTRPPLSCTNLFPKNSFDAASFDLHVLGAPTAFVLSQDQTLCFILLIQKFLPVLIKASFPAHYFSVQFTLLNRGSILFKLFCSSYLLHCLIFKIHLCPRPLERQLVYSITPHRFCQELFFLGRDSFPPSRCGASLLYHTSCSFVKDFFPFSQQHSVRQLCYIIISSLLLSRLYFRFFDIYKNLYCIPSFLYVIMKSNISL